MKHRGFTLLELLTVIVVIAVIVSAIVPLMASMKRRAATVTASSTLKSLVIANWNYAADNDGWFCPAQSRSNNTRWHGKRSTADDPFDATGGYLSPYLGESQRVLMCPIFLEILEGDASFEDGSGGFGYNSAYIGGTSKDPFQPIKTAQLPNSVNTVMFASTALAKEDGVQEYPFVEPQSWVNPNGKAGGSLQPSIHFRYNGKALIGWADGHVTMEKMSDAVGPNYYGGSNADQLVGWFGPSKDNGFLNPDFKR